MFPTIVSEESFSWWSCDHSRDNVLSGFFGGSVKADHDNHGLRTHRPKKSSGSKSNKNKSKGSNNKYSSPKKGGSGWNFHY